MGKWLTPDEPPSNQFFTRRLLIPASLDLIAIVDGLLLDLTKPSNWEQYGAMTPQETADLFNSAYDEMTSDYQEPPDAESPEDLDGDPQLPWYENVYDWIIAGFLAITFTPQAAIIYQATVPKLRVAFRTGNLGALFRILVNGVEMLTGDSYSATVDIADYTIDTSAITPPYTVRIEHNGSGENIPEGTAAKLEYIRMESVVQMVQTILRADPTGCGIQWSLDEGDTWETIDLATCITGLANDAIDQAIADGKIGKPGAQPGPEPPPLPAVCVTHHVILNGNSAWISPEPVAVGDSIHVLNAVGGWSDGGFSAWYCPDGARYILGECDEDLKTSEETDPLLTAYHMAVVGLIGETYFDPLTAIYNIPEGITTANFTLQANDADISDNQGTIEFDVEICKGGWNHEFDWRNGELGWAPWNYAGNYRAAYSTGNGWFYNSGYSTDRVQIEESAITTGATITHAEVWLTLPVGGTPVVSLVRKDASDQQNFTVDPGNNLHWTIDCSYTNPIDMVISVNTNGTQYNGYLYRAIFYGGGIDPF